MARTDFVAFLRPSPSASAAPAAKSARKVAYACAKASAAYALSVSDEVVGLGVGSSPPHAARRTRAIARTSASADRLIRPALSAPCRHRRREAEQRTQRVHGVEERIGALDAAWLAAAGHHCVVQECHLGGQRLV